MRYFVDFEGACKRAIHRRLVGSTNAETDICNQSPLGNSRAQAPERSGRRRGALCRAVGSRPCLAISWSLR